MSQPIYLSFYVSTYLSIYLCLNLSINLSICAYLPTYLPIDCLPTYLPIYIIYLSTCGKAFLETLTFLQRVKQVSMFYGTWSFIIALTAARSYSFHGRINPVQFLQSCFLETHFNVVWNQVLNKISTRKVLNTEKGYLAASWGKEIIKWKCNEHSFYLIRFWILKSRAQVPFTWLLFSKHMKDTQVLENCRCDSVLRAEISMAKIIFSHELLLTNALFRHKTTINLGVTVL